MTPNFCPQCGAAAPENAKFCIRCGLSLDAAPGSGGPHDRDVLELGAAAPARVGFIGAVKLFFHNYATFSGRANRAEYWWVQLFVVLLTLAALAAGALIGAAVSDEQDTMTGVALILAGLTFLPLILPAIALVVRRLHDSNLSGWWYLLALAPYIGGVALLVMMLLPGTPGPNRFGPQRG